MSEELTKDTQDALKYYIYNTPVNYGKSFISTLNGGWANFAGDCTFKWDVHTNTISTNQTKEKEVNKLYNVTVVDFNDEIIIDKKVVAKTEEEAKFKVDLYCFLKEHGFDLEDVDVFVTVIGTLKNRD